MHTIQMPQWAIERGRATNYFDTIELARTALLGIDMQNAFMMPGAVFANPHACDIVPNLNCLAAAVRRAGGLVVWTRQTISEQAPWAYPSWQFDDSNPFIATAKAALRDGAFGHMLHADMDVHADDWVLNKHRYSAFIQNSSDLHVRLQARGIDTLIVTGTLSNCCCDSSARDANMLGYKIVFASDATAAVTDAEHNAALLNLQIMFADVRSTAEILTLIDCSVAAT
ncbi:MAG: rutB 2 [Nevskia sp.]|nr:rutB 2 [Nevskia sp.]